MEVENKFFEDLKFPLLSEKEQLVLQDALLYMKMDELRRACQMLSLSDEGKKALLIDRILTFINTGNAKVAAGVPAASLAKNYLPQVLAPSSLILYGCYKNDAKTRAFFKKLIGPQFHFTAFGIDWINDRWLKGRPPTYQEFAHYWIEETKYREQTKAKPKDEWKYINFLQQMSAEHPLFSKKDLVNRWKKLQANKASAAFEILELLSKRLCSY